MNDLDQVILAARAEFEPSGEDRARVKRRLLARATGVGLATAAAAKSSAAVAAQGSVLAGQSLAALSKLFVGSLLVTFAGAGIVVAVTRGPVNGAAPAPSAHAASPQSLPSAPSGPARPAATLAPTVEPPTPGTATSAGSVGRAASPVASFGALPAGPDADRAATPPGDRLEAELTVLRQARLAADSGDLERARRLLDVLDRDHPSGILLEERAALRALTDCETTRGATARAARFLERYPASVYAAKVRRACALGPKAPPTPGATATFTDLAGPGH